MEVCCQTFDDGIMLQKISNVYDFDNRTSDKKCLTVFPPSPPCYSNVTLMGFQSNVRRCAQSWSFATLRDKKLFKLETLTLDQQCFQRKVLIKRGRCEK